MPHLHLLPFPSRNRAFLATILATGALFHAEAAEPAPIGRTHRIEIDFSQQIGAIRPLQGMNCGPWVEHFTLDLSGYFRELQVPYVRVHCPNWPGTDCVHIQYIFRNMDTDPDDPANYDFDLTDRYIAAIVAAGAKPIYNIGLGVDSDLWNESNTGEYRKAKSNIPPADFRKFARICANIARHYNQGWADGFHYSIKYWEIWNEPNLKSFWLGTQEQYVDLYAAVATALKGGDPALKVGGPGFSGGSGKDAFDWLEQFLVRCQQRNLPLDFCSWHCYGSEHAEPMRQASEVQRLLLKHGFPKAENHLNEWSPCFAPMKDWFHNPVAMRNHFARTGSSEGGAFNLSFLAFLQDSPVDVAAFYSGDTLGWGFVDRYGAPKTTFFAFKAFRRLLDTPLRVNAQGSDVEQGFAVLAGLAPDKSRANILISNYHANYTTYEFYVRGLPWSEETVVARQVVDQAHELDAVATERFSGGNTLIITAPGAASSVYLLELMPSAAK